MQNLIFIDTDTTGNELGKDRLCQVCFQTSDGLKSCYFQPPIPVSIKAMSITHITNKMLEDKEIFIGSLMAKELQGLLNDGILVAHNANFDCSMLEAENLNIPRKICTLRVARYLDKENVIPEYNLQYLRYYLDLNVDGFAHNAEDDVKVLKALFERLLAKMEKVGGEDGAPLSTEDAIEKMVEISARPSLFAKFNFGKHNGEFVAEVAKKDKNYLEWLLKSKLENDVADEDWIHTLKYYLEK